ncbi:MAG: radical SAM protein, partial [Lactococcus cremoris]
MFRDDELFLPIKVYIYLTNHCHYECDYCFLKEMKMLNTKEISKEDLEKIAYYLEKYKVPLVAICGGDPILHPSLINFVQLLSEHKNYPIIATNAVDISYEYLYQLKSAGIRYL